MASTKPEKKPKIEFDPEAEEGRYCSLAMVNFTPYEFIFDFGVLIPGIADIGKEPVNHFHTRIRTSPQHAKAFSELLRRKLEEYEKKIGRLEAATQQPYG